MAVITKNLGPVTAYGYALEHGLDPEVTEEEYGELMASYATVAEEAAESASDAEAYGAGTRDGVDVESTDPAYHNNAKYYAEQVGDSTEQIATNTSDITQIKSDLTLFLDEIKNTVQTYTFTNGQVSQILHKSGNDTVRTDAFTYTANSITETRTLASGATLTIVTNLATLETSVAYTAV